jgi:hypothetical protein
MPFSSKARPAYIGSPLNRDCAVAAGLVRRWPLIGQAVPDQVGGNALTKTGVTVAADPFAGMVSNFSGTAYYDSAIAVPFANGPYSLACWCMTNTTASSGGGGGLRYVVSSATGALNSEFDLRYSPGSGVFTYIIFGPNGGGLVSSSGTVAAYTPYLLVTTFDPLLTGGTMTFYVNGISQGTANTNGDTVSSKTISIGSDTGLDSRNRQFSGWISDVMVWNRELTQQEVWQLYAPSSRWDLYWQPNTRAYSFLQSAAAFDATQFPHIPMDQPYIVPVKMVPSGRVS